MNNILIKYSEIAKDYIKKANSLWGKVNFINVAEVLKSEIDLSELSRLNQNLHLESYSKKSEFTKYIDSLSEEEYDLIYEEQSKVEDLFYLVDSKFGIIDNILYELSKLSEKSEEDEYLKKFEDAVSLNVNESKKNNKNNNMKTNKILSESLMDKKPFKKIVFDQDLSKIDASDRLLIIRAIKEYKGESLKSDKNGVWYTFIPVGDVDKFMSKVVGFGPQETSEVEMYSDFKPRIKGLKDGQKIKFLDYNQSESNPPLVVGYLKPGFIGKHRSLLKYPDGSDYGWIDNKNIDIDDFFHRDFGDIDVKYTKVFFFADLDNATDREKEMLKKLIVKYGGKYEYVFGSRRASGGQRYALIPTKNFNDFYHEADMFEPYEAETERDLQREEEEMISEVRKIVRNIFKKLI